MPCPFNGESDIDQADVCERLREISERFARLGIYLFSKQANVIAKRQQMIELTFGLGEFASQSNLFESPKAADPKCPLVATQSIHTGFIALKQPVLPQSLANEVVGRSDARIVGIPITDAGHEEHAGIDLIAVDLSGIRLDLAIEASRFDQILRSQHGPLHRPLAFCRA